MGEKIQDTKCPDCGDTADLKADKRGKLYIVCPCCGRFTYNTNTGQERLRARIGQPAAPGERREDMPQEDDPAIVYDMPGDLETLEDDADEAESEEKEGSSVWLKVSGALALVVGGLIGWKSWQNKQA